MGAQAAWLASFWAGRTKEFFVNFTAIGQSYSQLGEAFVLRHLLGFPTP
ncbi:MAG: hypothetical protein ACYDCQ_08820 [Dehalococcoidia bacterium]